MQFRKRKMSNEDSLPFVKLKDGDTIIGVFAGDPFEFYQHWSGTRSVMCQGKDTCARCKEGDKGSFRFRLNFIVPVPDGKGYVAKVFEQGAKTYDYLADLNNEYGLEKTPVKITRKGTDKNTSYMILPQKGLNKEQLTAVSKVPLVDLAPLPAEQTDEVIETADDLPF